MIELSLDAPSGRGASVGRDENGRAVFVEGGLPGERVTATLTDEKKRFARGRLLTVLEPAPGRIEPICATARAGCGGCDLAHATLDLQHAMKIRVVEDALTRIARLETVPEVTLTPTRDAGYRTTVRVGVEGGRAGYRKRWRHDIVPTTACRVVHPSIEPLLADVDWGDATELTIRASEATGERQVVIDGPVDPATIAAPGDVDLMHRAALEAGEIRSITEEAAGRSWQLSAGSFFQAGPAAATALVDAVMAAAGDVSGRAVVDAYSGIGLFAGTVASPASSPASVTTIERAGSSTFDARANLDAEVQIIESAVEEWQPSAADIIIADPARSGLGQRAVGVLDGTGADRFVLVSCDTGALGRDVGLLTATGFAVDSVHVVDAFPDTDHVETVVAFSR